MIFFAPQIFRFAQGAPQIFTDYFISSIPIVIQRSIATKDLNTSTNSPLERGRGVLECIRFVCLTHPQPLSRGEKVYVSEILRFALNDKKEKSVSICVICGETITPPQR